METERGWRKRWKGARDPTRLVWADAGRTRSRSLEGDRAKAKTRPWASRGKRQISRAEEPTHVRPPGGCSWLLLLPPRVRSSANSHCSLLRVVRATSFLTRPAPGPPPFQSLFLPFPSLFRSSPAMKFGRKISVRPPLLPFPPRLTSPPERPLQRMAPLLHRLQPPQARAQGSHPPAHDPNMRAHAFLFPGAHYLSQLDRR